LLLEFRTADGGVGHAKFLLRFESGIESNFVVYRRRPGRRCTANIIFLEA
jgi:hypothetical protein